MELLENGLLKLISNILRVVLNNHKYNQGYGKLDKRFPSQMYSKDLLKGL